MVNQQLNRDHENEHHIARKRKHESKQPNLRSRKNVAEEIGDNDELLDEYGYDAEDYARYIK